MIRLQEIKEWNLQERVVDVLVIQLGCSAVEFVEQFLARGKFFTPVGRIPADLHVETAPRFIEDVLEHFPCSEDRHLVVKVCLIVEPFKDRKVWIRSKFV